MPQKRPDLDPAGSLLPALRLDNLIRGWDKYPNSDHTRAHKATMGTPSSEGRGKPSGLGRVG